MLGSQKKESVFEIIRKDMEANAAAYYQSPLLNFRTKVKLLVNFRFIPILIYRVATALHRRRLNALGKPLSLFNLFFFNIEIASQCEIGGGLLLPHPNSIIIGANKIGKNCIIFQQTTLGATYLDNKYTPSDRPSVGDNVIIGCGSKILGGVTIGDNAKIGANAVVNKSVPVGATAVGVPCSIIKK